MLGLSRCFPFEMFEGIGSWCGGLSSVAWGDVVSAWQVSATEYLECAVDVCGSERDASGF